MAQYMNPAAVMARASSRSEMWPARMPPTTPPTSNRVERVPAVVLDKYFPSISESVGKMYHDVRSGTTTYDVCVK